MSRLNFAFLIFPLSSRGTGGRQALGPIRTYSTHHQRWGGSFDGKEGNIARPVLGTGIENSSGRLAGDFSVSKGTNEGNQFEAIGINLRIRPVFTLIPNDAINMYNRGISRVV